VGLAAGCCWGAGFELAGFLLAPGLKKNEVISRWPAFFPLVAAFFPFIAKQLESHHSGSVRNVDTLVCVLS
jgi:hypothetical protein